MLSGSNNGVGRRSQLLETNKLEVVDQTGIYAAPLSPVGTPLTNECEEVVDQSITGSNQVTGWVRQLEGLMAAIVGSGGRSTLFGD